MSSMLACGSSPGPGGSGDGTAAPGANGLASAIGTVLGKTFVPASAAYYSTSGTASIVIDDAPGICEALVGTAAVRSSTSILFTVETAAAGRTYPDVYFVFVPVDGACNPSPGESGYGSVTITAANPSSVSGNFSFAVNSDSVKGSFIAPLCAGAPGHGPGICK